MTLTKLYKTQKQPMMRSSTSTHLDPPMIWALLSDEFCGMGVSTIETAGHLGTGACRLLPGPFHSKGLSVKAENFPLKLCQISGVFFCPNLGPHHLFPNSSRLHTSTLLILPYTCLLSLCCSNYSPCDTHTKSALHCPQTLSSYPPLSLSQALQSKN